MALAPWQQAVSERRGCQMATPLHADAVTKKALLPHKVLQGHHGANWWTAWLRDRETAAGQLDREWAIHDICQRCRAGSTHPSAIPQPVLPVTNHATQQELVCMHKNTYYRLSITKHSVHDRHLNSTPPPTDNLTRAISPSQDRTTGSMLSVPQHSRPTKFDLIC